jgi:diguanylate cyclase (GGDEF)-like protein
VAEDDIRDRDADTQDPARDGARGPLYRLWVGSVHYLAPAGSDTDYLTALRERTFVSFLLAGLVSVAGLILVALLFVDPASPDGLETLIGAGGWLFGQLLILLGFRRTAHRRLAVHLSLGLCLVAINATAWMSGGFQAPEGIASPEMVVGVVIPLLALATLGYGAGIAWLLIICANWLLLALAPQLIDGGIGELELERGYFEAMYMVLAGVIVLAISSITHSANSSLQRRLLRTAAEHEHRARHDGLTGLLNRAAFMDVLDATLLRCRRSDSRCALLIIDLTEFKSINDQHGHRVGDQLLSEYADILRKSLRRTDIAGRLGGDEFAVILEGITDRVSVNRALGKLVEMARVSVPTDSGRMQIRAALGVAVFPDDGVEPKQLYDAADAAMYCCKRRDLVAVFHADMVAGRPEALLAGDGSAQPRSHR